MSDANTELAKAYDPSVIEEKWARYWVEQRLFNVSNGDTTGKAFVMLLPPPNVTGRLHMGHMLNQTEMDILTRWHRMLGEKALWVPGTDHAGIATQMMVERQLAAEGTTRQALGREAFLERVWSWKKQYGGAITDQMRRLGASVDWSREYFTMDDDLSVAVVEAFVRLWEQGLVYRGAYIVNWDPVIQTAVSDLEVESEERIGKLYYIRYTLVDRAGESITIATTRPETMLGDVAVAVNPADARYTHLIGRQVHLPLTGRTIPIVADDWAKAEFGTGAVKVTPAHDANDFAIGQRHGLPNLTILDKTAHIDLPGSAFHGKDRFEARELIVAELASLGALEQVKDHPMTVPVSQRSGAVIEPRLSDQWFIRIQPLADKAIAAVREGHIEFTPEMYKKTYLNWMGDIHDWCVSRQLWWGHRIPAWYCGACKEIMVARTEPSSCTKCGAGELTQETDVLDTWFSSGLLPFTVFGWPGDGAATPDMAAFYPTDVLVTGFDILFFWVARMIMLGTHFMLDVPMPDGSARSLAEAVPFRDVYIHALVRDADRQKMSKTKGNVIDPIDIIQRFGTDAVRFTLASMASPGTDIAFSEQRTEGNRAFANKIWNAARFVFMNVERAKEAGIAVDLSALASALARVADQPLETRWIVSQLSSTAGAAHDSLTDYRFDEAANAVYQFFWGDFCDWYLEIVKLRLDFSETADVVRTEAALTTLLAVFESALRLLSPFMPFLTEEIWHALYALYGGDAPAKSIALTRYPQAADFPLDKSAEVGMNRVIDLIRAIRAHRKELGVPEKEFTAISMVPDARSDIGSTNLAINDVYLENQDIIMRLARVSSITGATLETMDSVAPEQDWVQILGPLFYLHYKRTIDVVAERERLTKEIAKLEKGLRAAEKQLGNEAFIGRAPAHIVEGLKKQAAETGVLYEKALAALHELDAM
jgi:valyl-tRNA synthetase